MTDTEGTERTDGARPVALVTGAGRGIGAATAERLAADHDLVLAARSRPELETVAERVDATAMPVPTDVTDAEAAEALVEATVERFGRLDAVVVNAGTGEPRDRPLEELSLEAFERVTRTNVDGAFHTVRASLPALRENEGTLVFLGSYKGLYPSTSTPVYAASKWWLRGFAHSVAGRAGPNGVAVSVINPTGVPTEFGRDLRAETNVDRLDPEETLSAETVADAVAYAVGASPPGAVAELNLFRRDVYARF
jgi:NADP-dependent 3-hydroxy acid dehydrogenase YdfG